MDFRKVFFQVDKGGKQQFCLWDKFTGQRVTLKAKSEESKDDWLARLQREVEGNAFRKLSNPMQGKNKI